MSSTSGMNDKSVVKGVELRADTAIAGIQSALPAGVTQLTVGLVTYQVGDLLKHAQELVKPWKDARAAHAVLRSVNESRPQDNQRLLDFLADFKIALIGIYGRTSEELTKFGFTPQKRRRKLSSEEKVLRSAKAKLTREKRHTQGSRQKADIRETGTPVVTLGPDGVTIADPAVGTPDSKPAAKDAAGGGGPNKSVA